MELGCSIRFILRVETLQEMIDVDSLAFLITLRNELPLVFAFAVLLKALFTKVDFGIDYSCRSEQISTFCGTSSTIRINEGPMNTSKNQGLYLSISSTFDNGSSHVCMYSVRADKGLPLFPT
jgi:hypothetical protein